MRGISRIGDLLEHSLNRHGARRGVVAAQVVDAANRALVEMFGKDIGPHLQAIAYVNREIRVAFGDTVAAAEMRNRSSELLDRVQALVPQTRVERLRLLPLTTQP